MIFQEEEATIAIYNEAKAKNSIPKYEEKCFFCRLFLLFIHFFLSVCVSFSFSPHFNYGFSFFCCSFNSPLDLSKKYTRYIFFALYSFFILLLICNLAEGFCSHFVPWIEWFFFSPLVGDFYTVCGCGILGLYVCSIYIIQWNRHSTFFFSSFDLNFVVSFLFGAAVVVADGRWQTLLWIFLQHIHVYIYIYTKALWAIWARIQFMRQRRAYNFAYKYNTLICWCFYCLLLVFLYSVFFFALIRCFFTVSFTCLPVSYTLSRCAT